MSIKNIYLVGVRVLGDVVFTTKPSLNPQILVDSIEDLQLVELAQRSFFREFVAGLAERIGSDGPQQAWNDKNSLIRLKNPLGTVLDRTVCNRSM